MWCPKNLTPTSSPGSGTLCLHRRQHCVARKNDLKNRRNLVSNISPDRLPLEPVLSSQLVGEVCQPQEQFGIKKTWGCKRCREAHLESQYRDAPQLQTVPLQDFCMLKQATSCQMQQECLPSHRRCRPWCRFRTSCLYLHVHCLTSLVSGFTNLVCRCLLPLWFVLIRLIHGCGKPWAFFCLSFPSASEELPLQEAMKVLHSWTLQNWRCQAASPQLQKAFALPFLQSSFGKILVLFFLDLLLLSFNRLCPTVLQAQAPHGIASPRHSTININNLPLPCKTNNAIIAAWAGISENRPFPLLLQPSFYMLLDSTCLSVLGSTALVSIASHCLQFAVINSACFSAAARCSSAIRARFCAGIYPCHGSRDHWLNNEILRHKASVEYCEVSSYWVILNVELHFR